MMSKTLNLIDSLLTTGRNLHQIGRTHDALRYLGRLADLRELPTEVAVEARTRLAEIHLQNRQYAHAQGHLTALLTRQPHHAQSHYLMASALDQDEKGDPLTALEHYRASLRGDSNQPYCLSEFGLLAVSVGEEEEGLKALHRAVELAPDEPGILGKLVEGLCLADRPEEARRTLQAALFRHSRHAGFRKLWSDFQFHQLREAQEASGPGRAENHVQRDEPVLLPFVRPVSETPPAVGRKIIRKDGPSSPAPPHRPRLERMADRKHA
jgi:tetratricopeptide (TPR) repeat protein